MKGAAILYALAIALLVLLVMVAMAGITYLRREDQPFKITTKRDDDKADVNVEQGKATVSIHSPFGISQAVIECLGKPWPEVVTIRLNLNGLENLQIADGNIKLEAAVSSQDGRVRLWKDGKEASPLDAKSPHWMEIRILDQDGQPTTSIPLMDGCFEMQLPRALFDDNPKSITLTWIDFYR